MGANQDLVDDSLDRWWQQHTAKLLASELKHAAKEAAAAVEKAAQDAQRIARAQESQAKHAAQQAEYRAAAQAKADREWAAAWHSTGAGVAFSNSTFATFEALTNEQKIACDTCESFPCYGPELADGMRPRAKNLWLLGPVGTGKTHLAVAMMHAEHFMQGNDTALVTHRGLIDEIRASWDDKSAPSSREVICKYGSVRLLVLDDVGTTYGKEAEQNEIFSVVDMRYRNGLETVITSNLSAKQLAHSLGERTYSRLRDRALLVQLLGEDHRRPVVMQAETTK